MKRSLLMFLMLIATGTAFGQGAAAEAAVLLRQENRRLHSMRRVTGFPSSARTGGGACFQTRETTARRL